MKKYLEYIKLLNDMQKMYNKSISIQDEVIRELRKEGFTQEVIGKMMSVSKGRVNQFCQSSGLRYRKKER